MGLRACFVDPGAYSAAMSPIGIYPYHDTTGARNARHWWAEPRPRAVAKAAVVKS